MVCLFIYDCEATENKATGWKVMGSKKECLENCMLASSHDSLNEINMAFVCQLWAMADKEWDLVTQKEISVTLLLSKPGIARKFGTEEAMHS